jgi:ATP/maltotriose-dependent transcriptional regulator MalT
VPGADGVASPVLVGRLDLLALAERRLESAAAGSGHLLLVSGEAGSGKTRLLASIAGRAEASEFAVLRAAAFPGDAEASGGVLLDLAGDLRRFPGTGPQTVGLAVSERLRDPVTDEGDPHRRRRLLVQDLADTFSNLDPGRRLLVVLEDLHWADQLSLEVLRHIAGRLASRTTLVVGAYRSDELYPGTPIREWRARLLSQRLAEEIRIPRLSLAETGTLIDSVLGRPAPAQLISTIHERSDGIPLHIEELLAAAADDSGLRFPDNLADAVLLHAQALDAKARDVAAAAAVIGRSFDFDLLVAVTQADPGEVDRCLRQLQSIYLVQAGADATGFDFRHALIRDALYADIPLPRRRLLHERVALVAVERGHRPTFVSAHFDQARLPGPAYRYALLGAAEAGRVSAHREALQLYQRALANLPAGVSPAEHATLLTALAREAAAVDANAVAAAAFASAHSLWLEAGDRLKAASVVAPMVAVGHLLGDDLDSRVSRLEHALADLPGIPDADGVRTQLLSGIAAAYMLGRRLEEAIEYGERSRAISEAAGDDEARLNTAATLGSVLVFAGRMGPGWAMLENAVSSSVERYLEAEAARSYRMIGSSASVLVEYDRAERWLSDGIAYATSVELWNHRSYMTAHLAHVQWAGGDWPAAQQTAEHAMADGRGGITTRITALYVLGYLAMGKGDDGAAVALLGEALDLGESMAELQRISPPLWGLAETALLRGDHATAIALCDRGFALSAAVADAAYLFPFLVTGTRARLALGDRDGAGQWLVRVEAAVSHRSIPGSLPAISHARGLVQLANGAVDAARESLLAARTGWDERRRFWEGAWATVDEAACALAARRYVDAASFAGAVSSRAAGVGASALVAAADELLQRDPRRGSAQPWHPLTAREWVVATLIAKGLTNRQIATELFLSPKTVSAHVEHVLAKLGASRRAEIAAWTAKVEP